MEEANKKLKSWGNDGELEKILSKGHKVCLVNGTYKKVL